MKSGMDRQTAKETSREVTIPAEAANMRGEIHLPSRAKGLVLFAHGSGSSRHSPRNQRVARTLREANIGTLLFDLLTAEEESTDRFTGHLRFDIGLLANRLAAATEWAWSQPDLQKFSIGYFGSSTGGGAALVAAAELGSRIGAVVSRGGRPDLAGPALPRVQSPTLLLVGGNDEVVLNLNEQALQALTCPKELKVIPGATHLFEEPGALEEVSHLAADWFATHLST